MCFSAGASFTGGAVISAIGIATLREAKGPSSRIFGSIPLVFAFQQIAEGVVWLTLQTGGNEIIKTGATFLFLIMALIIWPILIPYSVMRLEENRRRKRIISFTLSAGIFLSFYYAVFLVTRSVNPQINEHHIQYVNDFPQMAGHFAFGVYVIATIIPLFLSTVKKMYIFGMLVFLSCLITGFFYREYLTSVWCFFAALISMVIYFILKGYDRL